MASRAVTMPSMRHWHIAALLSVILLGPAGLDVHADLQDPKTGADVKFLEDIRGERIVKAFMKANLGYVESASKSDSGTIYSLADGNRTVVLTYDLDNKLVEKIYSCTDAGGNQISFEKKLVKRIKAGCPTVFTDEQIVADIMDTEVAKTFEILYPKHIAELTKSDNKYVYTMTYQNRLLEISHDGRSVLDKVFTCMNLADPVVYEKKIKNAMKKCLLNPSYIEYRQGSGIPENHPASVMLDIGAVRAFMEKYPFQVATLTDNIGSYQLFLDVKNSWLIVRYEVDVGIKSMLYGCMEGGWPRTMSSNVDDPDFTNKIMLGCDSVSGPQLATSKRIPSGFGFGKPSDVGDDHLLKKTDAVIAFSERYPDHRTWVNSKPGPKDVSYYSYTMLSSNAYMELHNYASLNRGGDGLDFIVSLGCIDSDDKYFSFHGHDAEIARVIESTC
ncbi:MAG: hypothetical protein MPJ06_09360 [Nitrosopumilus sp.]|nr:hypothetical protein [Nitrosopumilus sp.]MDA7944187.1 hypothetical protein [Nitrosopumilus sp.]MDA7960491.1 hypothetical protein [Nitrosopumilus sp.]MDA7999668.1 hypothetical protein [Nitrosopumilus sp.]